jgi:hypothetical protein
LPNATNTRRSAKSAPGVLPLSPGRRGADVASHVAGTVWCRKEGTGRRTRRSRRSLLNSAMR